jgi:hypothetical protein
MQTTTVGRNARADSTMVRRGRDGTRIARIMTVTVRASST